MIYDKTSEDETIFMKPFQSLRLLHFVGNEQGAGKILKWKIRNSKEVLRQRSTNNYGVLVLKLIDHITQEKPIFDVI